jgi:hypothetical protein
MDLFAEERLSDSPLVEQIWRSRSEEAGNFISVASTQWEIVITHWQCKNSITVRGPETVATPAYCPPDAEFYGIVFKPGAFMPHLPPTVVMNRCDEYLPMAGNRSFWLQGAVWELPTFDNAEVFIKRLVRDEVLVYDPLVTMVLNGHTPGPSLRTVQRRFQQATGLTHTTMQQIERARSAAVLLRQGVSILDTVTRLGYYDQPHLTRSMRQFIGMTPAQIADENRVERLSFLYNTEAADQTIMSA